MRSAQAGTAPLTGQPRPGGRRRARGAVSRLPTRRAGAAPAGKTQVTSVFSSLAPGLLHSGMRTARLHEAGFTLTEPRDAVDNCRTLADNSRSTSHSLK